MSAGAFLPKWITSEECCYWKKRFHLADGLMVSKHLQTKPRWAKVRIASAESWSFLVAIGLYVQSKEKQQTIHQKPKTSIFKKQQTLPIGRFLQIPYQKWQHCEQRKNNHPTGVAPCPAFFALPFCNRPWLRHPIDHPTSEHHPASLRPPRLEGLAKAGRFLWDLLGGFVVFWWFPQVIDGHSVLPFSCWSLTSCLLLFEVSNKSTSCLSTSNLWTYVPYTRNSRTTTEATATETK